MLMDALRPEHLGLQPPANDGQTASRVIRTQIVSESKDFELVIFLIPASVRLPLHDHPGMTVLSKVLYGSLAMRSYDWEDPPTAEQLAAMTAEIDRQEAAQNAAAALPLLD